MSQKHAQKGAFWHLLTQFFANDYQTALKRYFKVEHLAEGDYREVDLDSLEMSRPRSVGAEHITLEALRLLGLNTKFKELGFNGPQTAAAIGTIIGGCCQPGSELAKHAWLQEQSGLGELIDYDFNNLSLYGLYQVSDQLLKKKQ